MDRPLEPRFRAWAHGLRPQWTDLRDEDGRYGVQLETPIESARRVLSANHGAISRWCLICAVLTVLAVSASGCGFFVFESPRVFITVPARDTQTTAETISVEVGWHTFDPSECTLDVRSYRGVVTFTKPREGSRVRFEDVPLSLGTNRLEALCRNTSGTAVTAYMQPTVFREWLTDGDE